LRVLKLNMTWAPVKQALWSPFGGKHAHILKNFQSPKNILIKLAIDITTLGILNTSFLNRLTVYTVLDYIVCIIIYTL